MLGMAANRSKAMPWAARSFVFQQSQLLACLALERVSAPLLSDVLILDDVMNPHFCSFHKSFCNVLQLLWYVFIIYALCRCACSLKTSACITVWGVPNLAACAAQSSLEKRGRERGYWRRKKQYTYFKGESREETSPFKDLLLLFLQHWILYLWPLGI